MYRKWKEGQATKDEYSQVARKCRDGIRRAKAENDLRLTRDTKSNKKALFRYVNKSCQTNLLFFDQVTSLIEGML